MSYFEDYVEALIKDENTVNLGHVTLFFDSIDMGSYLERARWLNRNYNFLGTRNVEFAAELLLYALESWNELVDLDTALGIDLEDINDVANNKDILLKYKDKINLPDRTIELLEIYEILSDFKHNYKKVNDTNRSKFDKEGIKDLIYNKKYDVYDEKQVEALAELVYYNFSDEKGLTKTDYSFTELMNQIALNADLNPDIMKAAESGAAGWYASEIESQLDKVDDEKFNKHVKDTQRKEKRKYLITPELVEKMKKEYDGILDIYYSEGNVGLEDQRNDHIVVKFNGEVIYEDDGQDNDFGDIRLNGKALFDLLEEKDFKSVADLFFL